MGISNSAWDPPQTPLWEVTVLVEFGEGERKRDGGEGKRRGREKSEGKG